MKGVILAGGTGSRLYPLTKVTNKHLLPVYNKPMIYYPLLSMQKAGIKEVIIVSGEEHTGHFLGLLGSGKDFDMNISYEVQKEAGGIAQAVGLAEKFVGGDNFVVILGDNIIEDDLSGALGDFSGGAKVFLKKVKNPSAYGVAELDGDKIVSIIEKPANPKSDLAVVGCYVYRSDVFKVILTLKPSDRGELEITDVNNHYLGLGELSYEVLNGFWGDCGESFDSLMEASEMVRKSELSREVGGIKPKSKNEKHSGHRLNSLR